MTDTTPSTATDATASSATDATSTADTSSAAADTATSATDAAASTTGVDDAADRGVLRSSVLAIGRLLGDGLILGLWTVLLALLFLSTGGPRWAFYALLVLGAVLYAVVTPPWVQSS